MNANVGAKADQTASPFSVGDAPDGVPQVGVTQIGAPQVGAPQVGAPQVGVPQVGVPQVGVPQIGAPQVGALCWRNHGKSVQVLLITSRDTGRWVIPKGGIVAGKDAGGSAMLEAWEEAGVEGHLSSGGALGSFDYDKMFHKRQEALRCQVMVFPLRVDRLLAKFPEKDQRRRKWFKPAKAATQVMEPALRALLETLAEDASPLTGAGAAVAVAVAAAVAAAGS